MRTNCYNCGAPLKGGRCEYCGTEDRSGYHDNIYLYAGDEKIDSHRRDSRGPLYHDVTCETMTVRDAKGMLHRRRIVLDDSF